MIFFIYANWKIWWKINICLAEHLALSQSTIPQQVTKQFAFNCLNQLFYNKRRSNSPWWILFTTSGKATCLVAINYCEIFTTSEKQLTLCKFVYNKWRSNSPCGNLFTTSDEATRLVAINYCKIFTTSDEATHLFTTSGEATRLVAINYCNFFTTSDEVTHLGETCLQQVTKQPALWKLVYNNWWRNPPCRN